MSILKHITDSNRKSYLVRKALGRKRAKLMPSASSSNRLCSSLSRKSPVTRTRALQPARLRLEEIQLHADAVGIIEEKLRIAGARHDALAESHVPGLQALAHTFDIGRGKGDMVEAAGVFIFLLGAAHHDAFARLACAHQVHGGGAAGVEPVAGEVERRTIAVFQPEHIAIEILGALQIRGLDGVVLQSAEWHGLSP